ncbi:hypothetical protein R1sor_023895 [Riccia sorocarpa]|uniref:Serpin domain-containing protein n=1 Tax=Riccia sorocarpa TaxID=122646 RepID=A0ABD3GR98_9MARC
MELIQIVHGQIAYSLDLYKKLLSLEHGNVVVSPLSISAALAIIAGGARGETLNQMVSHLKFADSNLMHQYFMHIRNTVLKDSSSDGGPTSNFANCLLVDKDLPLNQRYRDLIREYYGAESSAVDFPSQAEWARSQVNMWVSQQTRGKIPELLPANLVNSATKMIIANAIYFKGQWEKKFDSWRTRDEPFFLLDGRTVSKPMMTSNDKHYIKNYGSFKVLRLPYRKGTRGDQAFSMNILLPNSRDGLLQLEKDIDATATAWFVEHLPELREPVPVSNFLLPRFSISTGFEVPVLLWSLGLQLPFDPDRSDLSGMLDELPGSFPPLFISNVVHKATVEVNEEGTVATAATATGVSFGSLALPQLEDFVADHPFLFLIREDHSGTIMFIGRVVDP